MDKQKILTALFDYLNASHEDQVQQKPAKELSAEERFIENIVQMNIQENQTTPPSGILHAIKLRNKQKKDNNLFKNLQSRFGFFQFHPQTKYVFGVLFILILLATFIKPWQNEKSQLEKMGVMATQYVTIRPGEILEISGLRMAALYGGEVAFEGKSNRQHVFFKRGDWHIETDYTSFNEEIWFHFPGGGVKPVAASFSVDIGPGKTKVTLNKGRMQIYSTDDLGVVNKTTTENAPYAYDSKNTNLASFYESDLLAERSNSMVVQKEGPDYHKELVGVYRNFIGSYISVLLNDGSQLNGVLKQVWNEKLDIQTGKGLVEVHGRNMTLVGLNTMDY